MRKDCCNGQVGEKHPYCAGDYDWWGSLWQCRKLMSQNHESSCREISPPKKNPNMTSSTPNKCRGRDTQIEKSDTRERSLCHCFTSALIHLFKTHFSLTMHQWQSESECQHIYRQTKKCVAVKAELNLGLFNHLPFYFNWQTIFNTLGTTYRTFLSVPIKNPLNLITSPTKLVTK